MDPDQDGEVVSADSRALMPLRGIAGEKFRGQQNATLSAASAVRVQGEPRSFSLVGPCEVRQEGSQRLEGLIVVIAGRANHVCTQEWPT